MTIAVRTTVQHTVLCACLLPGACNSFDISQVRMRNALDSPLPPMVVRIDEASLVPALGYLEDEVDVPGARIEDLPRPPRVFYTETVREDAVFSTQEFIDEARQLIDRELPPALFGRGRKGGIGGASVTVRFSHRKEHSTLVTPFVVPTVVSLGSLLLVGFPAGMQSATVQVSLRFTDPMGREVATYQGKGSSSRFAALYWGWNVIGPNFRASSFTVNPSTSKGGVWGKDLAPRRSQNRRSGGEKELFALSRAVIASAVVEALDDALAKIAADADRLRGRLR